MESEADFDHGELLATVNHRRRTASISDDYSIQKTNDDATECKLAAVRLGYWHDPYIGRFISHGGVDSTGNDIHHRDPEISRGYWARVAAVRLLLQNFIENAGKTCQIINLGCGFDTLYFRLKSSNVHFSRYIEIDFSSVTAKKIRLICKPGSPDLISMFDQMRAYLLLWIKLGIYANLYTVTMIFQICIIQIDILADIKTAAGHTELHTTDYHLIGADLRQINELNDKLLSTGIDFTLPTIVVCECVLIYMTPQQSAQLISYFADRFQCIGVINNEQMNLDDKFGEIMQQNLHIRGIKLAGHSACQTVETHKNRFLENGWSSAVVWRMDDVYRQYLPQEERERIEKLQPLDEPELLLQLLEHYCMVYAAKCTTQTNNFDPSLVHF